MGDYNSDITKQKHNDIMNDLTQIPTFELEEELDRRRGSFFYRGGYKHKKGCDSSTVNPVTEWCGGSEVIITGYQCPKCKMITKVRP